ncbi:MAG: hypothetical protein ABEJ31_04135 [Haloarculaceae archaeon]
MARDTDPQYTHRFDRRTALRSLAGGALAALVPSAAAGGVAATQTAHGRGNGHGGPPPTTPARQPTAGADPPANEFLASDYWAASHRNPYAQASSPYPALTADDEIDHDHNLFAPRFNIPITLAFTEPYEDGGRAIWGTGVGFAETTVFKLDPDDLTTIDTYTVPLEEPTSWANHHSRDVGATPSGAYTVLDRDGTFFTSIRKERGVGIDAYADSVSGDRESSIEHVGRYRVPDEVLDEPDQETFMGMTMTYDGHLAFCTSLGTVGVIGRDLSPDSARYLSLNGPDAPALAADGTDSVSNSIAADEDGGIYLLSSERLYRVQWTGEELTLDPDSKAWAAAYPTGDGTQAGRLGAGSGSTPSLMGVGDEDRFVVITDGRSTMHLLTFWRDEIPDGWEPPAGRDRRVAGEAPVTFGRSGGQTTSEQSVLVHGYGAAVVDNQQPAYLSSVPAGAARFTRFLDNAPTVSPAGVQRFEWDPEARELTSTWANPDVSLPNGIPCMSAETGLVYDVGQRDGVWNLTALEWDTGEVAFRYDLDPLVQHNSYYAATEIGPDRAVYAGAAGTVMQFAPADGATVHAAPVEDAESAVADARAQAADAGGDGDSATDDG